MNTTQIRTSLTSTGVNSKTRSNIAGVKSVLSGFKTYAESQSINLTSPSAPAMMKKHLEGLQSSLTASIAKSAQEGRRFGNDTEGRLLYAEMENIAKSDIATIHSRFASEINLYSESMLAGEYHPFQLAILPHVYLETIAANSRFLMPTKEYVSEQLPPRKMMTRQVVIEGKKYDFPHCLKNPDVMRKLKSQGSEVLEYELTDMTKKTFNIFTESGKGTVGQDSLVPQLDVIKVNYTDAGTGADEDVEMSVSAILPDVHNYTMGRLFKDIKSSKANATTTAYVTAEVNFATGDIKFNPSSEVKKVTFRTYKSGAYNRSSASIDMEIKPIIQVIQNRIHMIFDYDPGSMQNFLSLENIDGVLEGQSIMFDVVVAAKDQYAFDTLNGCIEELRAQKAAGFNFDDSDRGYFEGTHYTKPGTASGFRPTNTEDWNISEMAAIFKNVQTQLGIKFKSVSGLQCNWWASPINCQRFIRSTPIISKGENYGGVYGEYAVYGLQIAGMVAKMVETERAKDNEGFKCVPYSNMESQPTFEFQQGPHALFTDGTFRNPARPHMPAIAYYDYYDCNYILAILGHIEIKDTVMP